MKVFAILALLTVGAAAAAGPPNPKRQDLTPIECCNYCLNEGFDNDYCSGGCLYDEGSCEDAVRDGEWK